MTTSSAHFIVLQIQPSVRLTESHQKTSYYIHLYSSRMVVEKKYTANKISLLLLFGLETSSLTKVGLNLLDFKLNRVYIKLFKSVKINS
jgi:hypothetical protein